MSEVIHGSNIFLHARRTTHGQRLAFLLFLNALTLGFHILTEARQFRWLCHARVRQTSDWKWGGASTVCFECLAES